MKCHQLYAPVMHPGLFSLYLRSVEDNPPDHYEFYLGLHHQYEQGSGPGWLSLGQY
jgi:hypothetical protein